MDITNIILFGITSVILISILKTTYPSGAILMSIAASLLLLLMVIPAIDEILTVFKTIGERTSLDVMHLSTVLRIIGVAYLTEFGADICRESGSPSIASKIELGGKLIILTLAIPIILSLLDLVVRILP